MAIWNSENLPRKPGSYSDHPVLVDVPHMSREFPRFHRVETQG